MRGCDIPYIEGVDSHGRILFECHPSELDTFLAHWKNRSLETGCGFTIRTKYVSKEEMYFSKDRYGKHREPLAEAVLKKVQEGTLPISVYIDEEIIFVE